MLEVLGLYVHSWGKWILPMLSYPAIMHEDVNFPQERTLCAWHIFSGPVVLWHRVRWGRGRIYRHTQRYTLKTDNTQKAFILIKQVLPQERLKSKVLFNKPVDSFQLERNRARCLVHQGFWMSPLMWAESPNKLTKSRSVCERCFWWFPWETVHGSQSRSVFSQKHFAMPDMILFWMALCSNKVICLVQRREDL